MLQIEDPAGAECAGQMAAMDGVDVLWVGHNDLSVAMGIPGAFDDQRFQAQEGATIEACRKHGKSAGRLARDADEAVGFVARGYDFISIATDVALLQQAMSSGIARVRRG
jgi:2-dehydro-3-deoxyglucarate aldolase/4-hydroxy-2-oxoheptanedioate aldolase